MKLLATILVGLGSMVMARGEIHSEPVEYKQGDTTLEGWLAYDAGAKGKRPGVLIVPVEGADRL